MAMMSPTAEQEEKWRAEFENIGENAVRASLYSDRGVSVGIVDEPKRQYAFRWLREKEKDRDRREHLAQWHVKWTFWAAVGAVAIGIVGVFVTLRAGH
jgi:hypothetical protein